MPLTVKRSPPVTHESEREAGTLQWVRRAFGCRFPAGWETFLGSFWEPGVGLAPGAGLCMLRAFHMVLKLYLNTEWHEETLRRDNTGFSSTAKNTCNKGLKRTNGLQ